MPSSLYLILPLLSFSSSYVSLFGQGTPPPPGPESKYSQEGSVIEMSSAEIVFEKDGTNTRDSTVQIRIQSEVGVKSYAVLNFSYQSSSEDLSIDYVRVRKADGSVVVTPADDVQDIASEITRQAPSYSDMREKHVPVKGLGIGDVLESKVRWHATKPLIPGQFWFTYNFTHDSIILREKLQISVPKERVVKWASPKVKPVITETATRRLFDWNGSQLERRSKEEEEKAQETLTYQAQRGNFPPPEIEVSSFKTWDEVGSWYHGLAEARTDPTPDLRNKALELTKGLTDDAAKSHALYNYVSSQIHYIGINFGIGRYQPHAAGEVLANRYGDCKDKHTLLAALLAAVGIRSAPVLIGSTQELDSTVPSPAQFDHVITSVQIGNQLTWLDTTPEVAPYGYLITPLRGKRALLVSSGQASHLIDTPLDPLQRPTLTFRIKAKLSDEGSLQGKVDRTIQGGDGEVILRAAFRSLPIPQWKDLVQQISAASGFSGEVSDVNASSPEKIDEPFHFGYSYLRKDYPNWADRRVGSPLPPMGLPASPESDAKLVHPIWLGTPQDIQFESSVEIPKGYRPTVPKNLDVKQSFGEYHRVSTFKDGMLTTNRHLTLTLSEVPLNDSAAYRKFSKQVADDYDSTIRLASGASSPAMYQSEIWDLPYSDNPQAVKGYDDARDKTTKGDVQGAIADLRRSLEADPKFTRGWLWLGEIHLSTRQYDQAIAAYRKAIAIEPEVLVSYKALGYALLTAGKHEEAVATWQALAKLDPENSDWPNIAGYSLSVLKKYPEAISSYEAAVRISPELSGIQFGLGKAYLEAGEREKAIATFQKAVELNPNPFMLNNVAYEMAEAKESLPIALDYAKRAVSGEALLSHATKISLPRTEDLEITRSLSSYWDTLGWVEFRLGDLNQAEQYLTAAWRLSQNADVGDHLGQVYEGQNKRSEAIRIYRLALARAELTVTGTKLIGVIQKRLEHLSPGALKPNLREFDEVSSGFNSLRTTKLPLILKEQATAEYFVLFARDQKTGAAGIEDVKFISGSEKLRSADGALRSMDFKVLLPPDGQPRLLRRGILGCYPASGCSFTLLNPDDIRSVD